MGIVLNQSFKNTIITYIGFGIGAINTLYLYPVFLGATYYALTNYILSAANVIMPLFPSFTICSIVSGGSEATTGLIISA